MQKKEAFSSGSSPLCCPLQGESGGLKNESRANIPNTNKPRASGAQPSFSPTGFIEGVVPAKVQLVHTERVNNKINCV